MATPGLGGALRLGGHRRPPRQVLRFQRALRADATSRRGNWPPASRIFRWWREKGSPSPLLLTERELATSTDCFAIEFHDIKRHSRVLHGKDVITDLALDDSFYRAQVEHDLRAKLLRLRQKACGMLVRRRPAAPPAARFRLHLLRAVPPRAGPARRGGAGRKARGRGGGRRARSASTRRPSRSCWMCARDALKAREVDPASCWSPIWTRFDGHRGRGPAGEIGGDV